MSFFEKLRSAKRLIQFVAELYSNNALQQDIQRKWHKRNLNNFTTINISGIQMLPDDITVGNYTYGKLNITVFNEKSHGLHIGHFCSIADGNRFLLGGSHDYHRFSTYPFKAMFLSQDEDAPQDPILIEDDVWIGENVTIFPGIVLRRGTIVAAGSIVTKSSEPYSIIGGIPAKLIKHRFLPPIIQKLNLIDYSKLTPDIIKGEMSLLYQSITEDNVDDIVKRLQ